jgi:hypothetical protein
VHDLLDTVTDVLTGDDTARASTVRLLDSVTEVVSSVVLERPHAARALPHHHGYGARDKVSPGAMQSALPVLLHVCPVAGTTPPPPSSSSPAPAGDGRRVAELAMALAKLCACVDERAAVAVHPPASPWWCGGCCACPPTPAPCTCWRPWAAEPHPPRCSGCTPACGASRPASAHTVLSSASAVSSTRSPGTRSASRKSTAVAPPARAPTMCLTK